MAAWRARAIKMYPSDFRGTADDVRITLLAALCSARQAGITDALADLSLTALFWSNVNPYGTFRLDMDKRLDLGLAVPRPRTPADTVVDGPVLP